MIPGSIISTLLSLAQTVQVVYEIPVSAYNKYALYLSTISINGAQNNTFIDSSANALAITRNGNTTQGSFSPYGAGWSTYFNGTTDHLTLPYNSSLNLSGANWTMEVWFNCSDFSSNRCLFAKDTYGNNYDWALNLISSTQIGCSTAGFNIHMYVTVPEMTANIWNHIALVRNSGVISLYLNGIKYGEQVMDLDNASTIAMTIGCESWNNPHYRFKGYISNLRINNSTAIYLANFIPPTADLVAVTGTALLACQSNRFKDNSTNNSLITVVGTPKAVKNSPFISEYSIVSDGGSLYFDGAGDYLTTNNHTSLTFGSNDFTIEGWLNPSQSAQMAIIERRSNAWTYGDWALFQLSGVVSFFSYDYDTSGGVSLLSGNISVNQWSHFALVRNGARLYLYINGVMAQNIPAVTINNNTLGLTIGLDNSGSRFPFAGYMSDLRIVNGTAIYTSNFTVPQAPLTDVANTVFLSSGVNANIYDSTGKNVIETVGNAQVSTAVKKNGSSSIVFDGTGDYLTLPGNDNFEFGTGDFTIETYINFTSISSAYVPICQSDVIGSSSTNKWFFAYTTNKIGLFTHSGGSLSATATFFPNLGQWYLLIVERRSGTIKIFIDGIEQVVTGAATGLNYVLSQNGMTIGAMSTPFYLNGYIDDLKITKGVAKYTANFSVFPYTPVATSTYDLLYMSTNDIAGSQNNTFIDSSINSLTVSRGGSPSQGSFSPYSQNGWSTYFNVTSLHTPAQPGFRMDAGDWTLETWINVEDISATHAIASLGTYISSYNWLFFIGAGGTVCFETGPGTGWYAIGTGASAAVITANRWHHIAVVRHGLVLTIYVDGVTAYQNPSAVFGIGYSGNLFIGTYFNVQYAFPGRISNFRIVSGIAVYTTDFTVPTSALTAVAGTAVLTCQSNRFIDNSSNNLPILTVYPPKIVNTSPFVPQSYSASIHGGSIYLDGATDYLSATYNTKFVLDSDFTVEFWINYSSHQSFGGIVAFCSSSNVVGWQIIFDNSTNNILFQFTGGSLSSSIAISINVWNHIALVRSGSTITMYINGNSVGTTSSVAILDPGAGTNILIGIERTRILYTAGYLSDIRVIKGTAVYKTAFTPPQAPLIAIANTQLLLSGTDAGIYDSTGKNVIETVGNINVSTTVRRNGNSSIYVDGVNTSYAYITASSSSFMLGTSDFTIEFWYKSATTISAAGGWKYVLAQYASATNNSWGCRVAGADAPVIGFSCYDTSAGNPWVMIVSTANPNNQQWHHVAYVRSSTSLKIYMDGTQVGSGVLSSNFNLGSGLTNNIRIGGDEIDNASCNGYIEDMCITKGLAKYTSNFIPNTTTDIELLFNSANGSKIITNTGTMNLQPFAVSTDAYISTAAPISGTGSLYQPTVQDYIFTTMPTGYEPSTTPATFEFSFVKTGSSNFYPIQFYTPGWVNQFVPFEFYSGRVRCGSSPKDGPLVSNINVTHPLAMNTVYHCATTFDGTTWRVYIDGVMIGSSTTMLMSGSFPILLIGNNWELGGSIGEIDNVRITFGVAKYTGSSYTVSNV